MGPQLLYSNTKGVRLELKEINNLYFKTKKNWQMFYSNKRTDVKLKIQKNHKKVMMTPSRNEYQRI